MTVLIYFKQVFLALKDTALETFTLKKANKQTKPNPKS